MALTSPVSDELRLNAALTLDAAGGTFAMRAYDGGKLYVDNFHLPVVVDLAGMSQAPQVKALMHHLPADPAGHMTRVVIGQDIRTQGVLSVPAAQDRLRAAQQRGFQWEASIGATVDRSALERIEAGRTAQVNGRTISGPCLIARKTILREVSFTGLAAGQNTSARLAATAGTAATAGIRNQESGIRNQKMPQSKNSGDSDAGKADNATVPTNQSPGNQDTPEDLQACLGNLETKIAATVKQTVDASIEAALKPLRSEIEANRIERINTDVDQLAARYGVSDQTLIDEVKGQVQEGKLSELAAENAILRASQSRRLEGLLPFTGTKKDGPAPAEVLEAAYLANTGWSEEQLKTHGRFDDRTINASLTLRGLGPHALAVETLRSKGHHVLGGKLQEDDIRAALHYAEQEPQGFLQEGFLRASGGMSTISLPGILSNVARKEMLRGRDMVKSAIRRIARRSTAADYKPYFMYRLNTAGLLQQVGSDGELKAMSLQEDAYTARVYPYGRKLAMTAVMFQNDDANAFSDLAFKFGRVSQLTEEKIGFTVLLAAQATFWTTVKGNRLAAGGASALSMTSLGTALALFRKFTDGTSDQGTAEVNPIGVDPRFLVHGPTDEVTARNLNTSTTINLATGENLTQREAADNPWKGMFEPVLSPFFVTGRVTNATDTQWLLTADPADTAPIVVAYLSGRANPSIQHWEKMPGHLGMQWDITHNFGFSPHDDKASVYSPGA